MDETRARFLAAIASQLDVERVAEIHLFPAIRQGGMESGVAVLALDLVKAPELESEPEPLVIEDVPPVEIVEEASPADVEAVVAADDDPYRSEPLDVEVEVPIDLDVPEKPTVSAPARRFTVYTARYRHTLKGPDRGKWEVSVTEEADAPLLTVDAVVRGVQRRSGDVDDSVRLSGDEMRAALPVVAGQSA